jgi:hypothetical protein
LARERGEPWTIGARRGGMFGASIWGSAIVARLLIALLAGVLVPEGTPHQQTVTMPLSDSILAFPSYG